MATIQEIINLKAQQQKALNQQKLKELFSEVLLGVFSKANRNTFEEILTSTSINLSAYGLKGNLKGLNYLKSLTTLNLPDNYDVESIGDIAGMTALTNLQLQYNKLQSVGELSNLTNLTTLRVDNNQLNSIGFVDKLTALTILECHSNLITKLFYEYGQGVNLLTNLVTLRANQNQLTFLGSVSNLTKCVTFIAHSNKIPSSGINTILSQFKTMLDGQAPGDRKLATLELHGTEMGTPADGVNNANGIALALTHQVTVKVNIDGLTHQYPKS